MVTDSIRRFFAERDIAPCRIVAAVSGGADSTALLIALVELDFDVVVGHVNHHLRGEESDGDEAFVRDLCARRGVPIEVVDGTLDEADVKRAGIEAAARDVRTRLLLDIKERRDARFVATAHQKNDQAETIVMRLFTGSGIAGLRGIHPLRDDGFIRPMLDVTRGDVDVFLRAHDVTPRVDSTNADPRFLRNRIRATLREYDASVIENIAGVAEHARAMWKIVQREIDAIEVAETADEARFVKMPEDPVLRHALLQRHLRRLDPQARATLTRSLELITRNDQLILRRKPKKIAAYEFDITAGETIDIPPIDATFTIHPATEQPRNRATQPFQLPPGAKPNFVVRNRRHGDRFRPLGLGHEKKLKDLLIDRKIPVEERDRIPLLIWNGEIVWVAGVEISDTFKIVEGVAADRYEASVVQSTSPA